MLSFKFHKNCTIDKEFELYGGKGMWGWGSGDPFLNSNLDQH